MNNDEKNSDFRDSEETNLNQENNSLSENYQKEEISNEPILAPENESEKKIEQPITNTPTKQKNPYKIAFISLGSVILLGGASFFGYQYYKSKQVQPIVENVCLDSDTKIYDAYKDAVVMVKHRYAFFANIRGKEVQLNIPEASERTLYGTAFFVDKKGNMISNSHVLEPWNSSENADTYSSEANEIRRKIASILTTDIEPDGYETFIASNWGNASSEYYHEGDGDYREMDDEGNGEEFVNSSDSDSAVVEADIAASIPIKEYISEDDIEVYMKTIDISVALHNTSEDWLPCEVGKVSKDPLIDLGVLQLISKETPNTVVNLINLNNAIVDDESLRPGEKAVMIGYPLGENLAQTISGIKVQLYNGQISKESDGTKIQYTVTSTHGASGSPIFNNCGDLIAVNFSGLDKIQGYNFGIIAKQINTVYPFKSSKVDSLKIKNTN